MSISKLPALGAVRICMRALFDAIFIGRASFMKVDHVLSPGIMIYLCRMGKVDIAIP